MNAKIISFFSPKGGVGKTLFSMNLAVSLAIKGKKVLLFDLDLGVPQLTAKLLGLEPKYCLYNLISHLQEFKDKKRNILNYTTRYGKSLFFLPSITKLAFRTKITADVIKIFLEAVSSEFDFVVIDAGSNLTDNLITTFDASSLILLVLTPDILSVYQTEWVLDTLQSIGFPLKMVKTILNRAESKGSISWQEIKLLLASEIISLVPSEGKIAGLAMNRSVPIVIDSPKSKITLAIDKLADTLIMNKDIYVEHKDLTELRVAKEELLDKDEAFWEKIGLAERIEKSGLKEEEDEVIKFKKKVHQELLEALDLKRLPVETFAYSPQKIKELRKRAERVISNIISKEAGGFISSFEVRKKITKEILDEALALGPLEDLLKEDDITEVMVNNTEQIYVEKAGKIYLTSKKFTGDEQVRIVIERIIAPLGRRIDESVPYVDARLPDGSRVNAIISPLSLTGPTLTIRKFARQRYCMKDLTDSFGTLTPDMALFLDAAVKARKNILVSGGTGSGKTTFLNILSSFIPETERIVTIEDSAELKLDQIHWIRLESRPPNIEGRGEITVRDLFKNSLRMRPDRIIVGEVRGYEVIDMLQAMNTGHDGSMSTIHANTTHDVLIRLDSMILMSGVDLPIRSIREMISSAIHLIVQTARLSDGSRKVTAITEVVGMLDETHVNLQDIFYFRQTGVDGEGKVKGYFTSLGYIPTFYDEIRARGINLPREVFISKE